MQGKRLESKFFTQSRTTWEEPFSLALKASVKQVYKSNSPYVTEFLLGNKAECVNEVNKFAQGIGICQLQHLRVGKICELLGNRESKCCDRNTHTYKPSSLFE